MSKTILTVDDGAEIRMVVSEIFRLFDCAVLEASSAEEGLMLATCHGPDLILLDVGMPGMDGVEMLAKLKADLPRPDLAKPNDSHYGMAMRFLKKKGVSDADAKKLVSRVAILEKLAPGFEVYHFYANGTYGTWVSQGKAKISPNDLMRQEREKVEGERDVAVAQNEKLQEEVLDLEGQKKPMWPTIVPSATPFSNCATVVPTPWPVMTVGPNGERSLTREASMESTRRQMLLHMTMRASSTKPGLMPVPRMVTSCSLASLSNISARAGSLAHG